MSTPVVEKNTHGVANEVAIPVPATSMGMRIDAEVFTQLSVAERWQFMAVMLGHHRAAVTSESAEPLHVIYQPTDRALDGTQRQALSLVLTMQRDSHGTDNCIRPSAF